MNTPVDRIVLSNVSAGQMAVALFYDLVDEVIVDELTDFLISKSEELRLDQKTIFNTAYDLRRFWSFLLQEHLTISTATDRDLAKFRDAEFKSVMSSVRSKQKNRTAQGTINARLRWVYIFFDWLQKNDKVPPNTLGEKHCRIRSSLPRCGGILESSWRANHARQPGSHDQKKYPLLFRNIGAKSKHTTNFIPTERVRFSAIESIQEESHSDYLAHRNVLFIDIANTVGWRRASINSLTINDIYAASSRAQDGGYASICPASQKFGYTENFDIPSALLGRIIHYIENYLLPFAQQNNWKIDINSSNLFLGINGRALKDRSVTQIISKAMRSAGAPAWSATHSFRRKFANDEIVAETNFRLAEGLDTTAASIAASVSIRLGHKSPHSIAPYVSRSLTARRLEINDTQKAHIDAVERENIELKARLRRLEASDVNS